MRVNMTILTLIYSYKMESRVLRVLPAYQSIGTQLLAAEKFRLSMK